MPFDEEMEKEIQAAGKTAPRVTPEHIESIIVGEHYFTAAEGARAATSEDPTYIVSPTLYLLTFCVLELDNGFTVTGESACVSPENFDAEIGKKIARQNAVAKIWPLEGYALAQRLHEGT